MYHRSFQSICMTEKGLSDFHLMTLTLREKTIKNFSQDIYRSYKDCSIEIFREILLHNLSI